MVEHAHETKVQSTCRQKSKEELAKLQQQLASVQSASKGDQQASDRIKKEVEKARYEDNLVSCTYSSKCGSFKACVTSWTQEDGAGWSKISKSTVHMPLL